MSLNDSMSNAFSAILNAEQIGKREATIQPVSKLLKKVLEILQHNHYLGELKEVTDSRGNYYLLQLLGRINKCGAIKPRMAVGIDTYEKFEKRYLLAKGFGIIIVSTNQGIMTHVEAKEKKLGGKLLAYCY
ncbi:30S ribosomal protein S8 [Candidatus Woesearchaeota archaeon]|nr:30S ribosomal protein S8 [Candidatus Woesearchaeota archaeon]